MATSERSRGKLPTPLQYGGRILEDELPPSKPLRGSEGRFQARLREPRSVPDLLVSDLPQASPAPPPGPVLPRTRSRTARHAQPRLSCERSRSKGTSGTASPCGYSRRSARTQLLSALVLSIFRNEPGVASRIARLSPAFAFTFLPALPCPWPMPSCSRAPALRLGSACGHAQGAR